MISHGLPSALRRLRLRSSLSGTSLLRIALVALKTWRPPLATRPLSATGQLALTVYVGHLLLDTFPELLPGYLRFAGLLMARSAGLEPATF